MFAKNQLAERLSQGRRVNRLRQRIVAADNNGMVSGHINEDFSNDETHRAIHTGIIPTPLLYLPFLASRDSRSLPIISQFDGLGKNLIRPE